ncbi:MAG: hypothetical protein ACLGI6_00830, partial [Gammaproteobacteria bacterium]
MRTLTRLWMAFMLAVLASACVTAPPAPPPPSELFSDARFKAPTIPVNPEQLFTLSPAMRDYLHSAPFRAAVRQKGPERGLVDAHHTVGVRRADPARDGQHRPALGRGGHRVRRGPGLP